MRFLLQEALSIVLFYQKPRHHGEFVQVFDSFVRVLHGFADGRGQVLGFAVVE